MKTKIRQYVYIFNFYLDYEDYDTKIQRYKDYDMFNVYFTV